MVGSLVLVDSSIWISAFRNARSSEAMTLGLPLDEDRVVFSSPVKAQIPLGADRRWKTKMFQLTQSLNEVTPQEEDWERIFVWATSSRSRGETFALGDLLIASLSHRIRCPVWSLGQTFLEMSKLGWIEVFPP